MSSGMNNPPHGANLITLPIGSPVQYYSKSRGSWIDARVTGTRPDHYLELDCQPMAAPNLVRPLPRGTAAKYYSSSQSEWIDAVVQGFDAKRNLYELNVHPGANPAKITVVPAQQAQDGVSSGTYQPRVAGNSKPSVEIAPPLPQVPAQPPRQILREFKCPLCLMDSTLDESVCLDCNHQLCQDCFGHYCCSKIQEGKIAENELMCPATTEGTTLCATPITVEQVRGAVSSDMFEKFCKFRAAVWKPSKDDGKLLRCPSPDCASFVVPADARDVKCPKCRLALCAWCGKESHPGETCEQFAKRKLVAPKSAEEAEFQKMLEKQGWMRCPACNTPTAFSGGCFFMKCESEVCRGRTHFCYLCGDFLRGEDHVPGRSLAHFPRGPYNMECINVSEDAYRKRLGDKGELPDVDAENPFLAVVHGARRLVGV